MKKKVFIACSGLGYVNRGFEASFREIFDNLSKVDSFEVYLFKGKGRSFGKERALTTLQTDNPVTVQLSRLVSRIYPKAKPGIIRQSSMFFSLLPHLISNPPDVVYISETFLGSLIWRWRSFSSQKFKILFRNGGPSGVLENFKYRWDHVQQLAPTHLKIAMDAGVPSKKQTLVPIGFNISPELTTIDINEKQKIRQKLNLPIDRPLLLSVGAINKYHKRMDYVICELAKFQFERPYLLMLGQQHTESSEILKLGKRLLGENNFGIRTVPKEEVELYYQSADIFVLASLTEGFGRVYVEAMSYGLPCIAHDSSLTKYILGDEGYLGDLRISGSLEKLLSEVFNEIDSIVLRKRRHKWVYEHFSWDKILPDYIRLIENCLVT